MNLKDKSLYLFGFFTWLFPFIVSFIIFPLKKSDPTYFQTLMSIVLVLFTIIFTYLYFKRVNGSYINTGILVGILWLLINLILDFLFFIVGPFKMPITQYLEEIGFGYIVIPIITIGTGYLLEKKQPKIEENSTTEIAD